ncbi:hypothetical protein VRU48_05635 [Pedobacter sp. KR3-3]|uniref:Uncharacterized protein n=1 Tax=Pedobacter albus TaxID=3113905 RepID=A0ABU7I541_9SPHI|nr:hypothetical protein [Pedobacter sp. KR3-3]MEE1944579.1 hypothetical protein [Pedobacter sp. KR3-3]
MKTQSQTVVANTLSNKHYIYIGLFILLLQAIFHLSVDASIVKHPKSEALKVQDAQRNSL